jgi:hypothetical protein
LAALKKAMAIKDMSKEATAMDWLEKINSKNGW